jgi:hypothetical protein
MAEKGVGGCVDPGVIAPPIYSFLELITSKVIAVPRSTIMKGASYLAIAPSAFAILSAPNVSGSGIFMKKLKELLWETCITLFSFFRRAIV